MSSILQRETISSCQTLLSPGESIEDLRFWTVSERSARCPESLPDKNSLVDVQKAVGMEGSC
jgi:hypothetical protein